MRGRKVKPWWGWGLGSRSGAAAVMVAARRVTVCAHQLHPLAPVLPQILVLLLLTQQFQRPQGRSSSSSRLSPIITPKTATRIIVAWQATAVAAMAGGERRWGNSPLRGRRRSRKRRRRRMV